MDRKARLQELLAAQAAAPVRAELSEVLAAINADTSDGLRLDSSVDHSQIVELMQRDFSNSSVDRVSTVDVATAAREVLARLEHEVGAFRIMMDRPGAGGLVGDGPPTASALTALAEWDGEGLIVYPATMSTWALIDLDQRQSGLCVEVVCSRR